MIVKDFIIANDESKIPCTTYLAGGGVKWFPLLPVKLRSGKWAWLRTVVRFSKGHVHPDNWKGYGADPDYYTYEYENLPAKDTP